MTDPKIIPVGQEPGPIIQAPRGPARERPFKDRPSKDSTASSRFQVLNAFVDFTLKGLNRGQMAVWLILYRDTKPDGTATTSVVDLARRAGADRATVMRAIKALVARKLLAVVYRGNIRCGPSRYRVIPVSELAVVTRDET